MPENNHGPYQLASSLQYGGTPAPTGELFPPQSPTGALSDKAPDCNFEVGMSSTQIFLARRKPPV
jgi:hypothetical protein